MRLAAMADLHFTRTSSSQFREIFGAMRAAADVALLCGDLTDYGLVEEARLLVEEMSVLEDMPVIAVLGNHDYHSDQVDEVKQVLIDGGVLLLDGDACEIDGVGFAGAKGFAGGFDRGALEPWGEPAIKAFVQEAVDEALKLEGAVARLHSERRVAVLHYAPLVATVSEEPQQIFSWLGSSRLAEPLSRYPVDVVFHGHAHSGSPEGDLDGTPVYNVSMPVLRRHQPEQRPFRIVEI